VVRDTAQRAAKALDDASSRSNQRTLNATLLPALETGLFNDEWRVRSATVQLLSDTLHLLAEQTDDRRNRREGRADAAAAAGGGRGGGG
jgi:hypothetical protein